MMPVSALWLIFLSLYFQFGSFEHRAKVELKKKCVTSLHKVGHLMLQHTYPVSGQRFEACVVGT